MQIPHFSESHHPMIKSLSHLSDRELVTLFQRYPEQGKYFVTIFCRYNPIVYTLVRHSARSPVQADYLFALTWRHIFYELRGLDLREETTSDANSFQNWLINMTAICINQADLPPVESIHYNLKSAPPPLWCYLEQALDQLLPALRLMVVMAQTFHWSETRIAAYLQAEGEVMSPQSVRIQLQEAYQLLESGLPEDIAAIYLIDEALETTRESQLAAVPI
ncbi:MAG TPA: RNA polymerase subunit sigma-70 [Cyanobacteria bacterium UBA11149]|nr:RNA polymerase subunit sigma-70 [Cyanobacteria bacterium UBA11367]HBE56619.1 RNA polymerase subunit sigma-70 [Cyanobacteria bacterium UBA11366]HBK65810.1 RNA polymerase subunit sigma-70 [Cyanobacteria bacterium UBA11166]HBR76693.1 RNA polymerase subunit sigma-70 [Cyanobacteria bacterium UBA11159]HBS72224.1 RNA polymerase subunit sigma-70 [Cyanobacteria bacterium UBA11153]HBW90145.1 RNA polymerase subunit sigma-70 [Cyanobacteria bacterium UBA11149]HCA94338.1 RNA polymerase subunit sigma-70 